MKNGKFGRSWKKVVKNGKMSILTKYLKSKQSDSLLVCTLQTKTPTVGTMSSFQMEFWGLIN